MQLHVKISEGFNTKSEFLGVITGAEAVKEKLCMYSPRFEVQFRLILKLQEEQDSHYASMLPCSWITVAFLSPS